MPRDVTVVLDEMLETIERIEASKHRSIAGSPEI